jgi:hypothetical protein
MRNFLVLLVVTMLYIGCDKSNPIDTGTTSTQSDAVFGELSMQKTALGSSATSDILSDTCIHMHDSIRNVFMLDSLKAYLSLTDVQFESVKTFGSTLNAALADIHVQVEAKTITPDSAMTLVKAARDQFVASVKTILTADQLVAFDTWLANFWNRPPHGREGHGGPGGRGGQGGRGGHGGPRGPGGPGGRP